MDHELMADGLWFPEGPVAMNDGSVVLVEAGRQTITRVARDGSKSILAKLEGVPNGAAVGPDGALYICDNGGAFKIPENWTGTEPIGHADPYPGGQILRLDMTSGAIATLYDACDGRTLNAPNDIVFDSAGGFWFTCHGFSDNETRLLGGIYHAKADGSQIKRVRGGQYSPNGIGLSPDGRTVYWADTFLQRLWALDIETAEETSSAFVPARVVVSMPGLQSFDSLAVEESGRVCVATIFSGAITSIDPATGDYEQVDFGDPFVTNIAFGGSDMRDAFVTCSSRGRLVKARWPRPGLRLAYNA